MCIRDSRCSEPSDSWATTEMGISHASLSGPSLWEDGTYTNTDFEIRKTLGKGTSGTARLAVRLKDKFPVVLKDIEMVDPECDDEERQQAAADELKEVEVLLQMNHPCIVSIFGAYQTNSILTIVMAYCDGGSLDKRIREVRRRQEQFGDLQVASWLVQILLALNYMAAHNILHRDLKPGNIFITGNDMIKVGDFGMARIVNTDDALAQTACGTPYYLSPEICQGNSYGPQNDLWAAGVIAYEVLTLKRPFEGRNLASVIMQICHTKLTYPPKPKVSAPAKLVIDAILTKDPAARPTVQHLLQEEWLRCAFSDLKATHPSLGVMPSPANEVVRAEADPSSSFDKYLVSLLVAVGSRDHSRAVMVEQSGFGQERGQRKEDDRRLVVIAKRAFGGVVLGELHERMHCRGNGEYDLEEEAEFVLQLEAKRAAQKSQSQQESRSAPVSRADKSGVDVRWVADDEVSACTRCGREFSLFCRRHHCRLCGQIFCSRCCDRRSAFPHLGFHEPVRACLICYPQQRDCLPAADSCDSSFNAL
eukprot:TRINITY_DN49771_c0_g1_i1.p1 TRINITY_DN49771_c0_g1~~TRINITY_DN49771_c0_g1_i1.p1  ORF type:complete len:534 (+),score=88.07 TRINITY_DN49771_c0_g1_i1:101-1702(+)